MDWGIFHKHVCIDLVPHAEQTDMDPLGFYYRIRLDDSLLSNGDSGLDSLVQRWMDDTAPSFIDLCRSANT